MGHLLQLYMNTGKTIVDQDNSFTISLLKLFSTHYNFSKMMV